MLAYTVLSIVFFMNIVNIEEKAVIDPNLKMRTCLLDSFLVMTYLTKISRMLV
jgi:hypothetical protein